MQDSFRYPMESLRKNWEEQERPTCLDAAENRLLMGENELDKAIDEHQKVMAKAISLTQEERMTICDMGFYNDVIKGYLIVAMRYAGFKNEEIKRALRGLVGAFDDKTADEAAAVYDNFSK